MDEQKFITHPNEYFPLGVLAMPGASDLSKQIDKHLTKWYHDLYRPSHRPYDPKEIELIKSICAEADRG